jgi:Domain of Unknown Function (DUF1206)
MTAMTAVRDVEHAARVAKHSDTLEALARLGFIGFGLTHLVLAWIAVRIAFGRPPSEGDQIGAFAVLRQHPVGTVLLAIVAVGLTATALWQALEAAVGHAHEESAAMLRERLFSGARALGYGLFAFYAAKLVLHPAAPGAATDKQQAAGTLLGVPGGQLLVGAIGIGVVAVGLGLGWYGLTRHFERHLRTGSMTPSGRHALGLLGAIGYAAKAVAYAIAGVLVVIAAVRYDASQSRGLDAALQTLSEHVWGHGLLLVIATGIAAFGLFAIAQARYREV